MKLRGAGAKEGSNFELLDIYEKVLDEQRARVAHHVGGIYQLISDEGVLGYDDPLIYGCLGALHSALGDKLSRLRKTLKHLGR